ncbi:MAG: hypothetical protein J6Y53_04550 [Alphaproteobacteria bacterium]|nr:hypothetical protein [Alphaproteobacteria bacterium]
MTFAGFYQNDFCALLAEYRFQLYLLLAVIFIYAFCKKIYLLSFIFFILSVINFFAISSTSNFFNSGSSSPDSSILFGNNQNSISPVLEQISRHNPEIIAITNSNLQNFEIQDIIPDNYKVIAPDNDFQNFIITRLPIKQSGRIDLNFGTYAAYAILEKNELPITYIAVDFSEFLPSQIDSMLKKISLFITQQDNPVVVFGNFNTVSWSYNLSAFIAENNLSVQNALFDNIRNPILPPQHYILGYSEGNFSGNIIMPFLNSFAKFTRF